uniref:Putative secreted peptide n=1 Tax=Anopheles braziliensis TaxID=58242 RepID=A0A2M3ZT16_9DIPT
MVGSVWWRAGMARIVRAVSAASTVSVRYRAPTTVSVVNGRPALPVLAFVRSDAVVARIAADRRLAATSSVWIRASRLVRPVDRMRFARASTTYRDVRVRPGSRVIRYRSRAVCGYRAIARRRNSVPPGMPVSRTSVLCRARKVLEQEGVQSVNDAMPVFAPRFATPTTTVCRERCAVRRVCVSPGVPPTVIVHRNVSAKRASAVV